MKKTLIALAILSASGIASAQFATATVNSAVTGSTFANSGSIPGGTWSSHSDAANNSSANAFSISNPGGGGAQSGTFADTTGNTHTNASLQQSAGNGGAGADATQVGNAQGNAQGLTQSSLSPQFDSANTMSQASVGTQSHALAAGFTGSAASDSLANARNQSNAQLSANALNSTVNTAGFANATFNSQTTGVGNSANSGGFGFANNPGMAATQQGAASTNP